MMKIAAACAAAASTATSTAAVDAAAATTATANAAVTTNTTPVRQPLRFFPTAIGAFMVEIALYQIARVAISSFFPGKCKFRF